MGMGNVGGGGWVLVAYGCLCSGGRWGVRKCRMYCVKSVGSECGVWWCIGCFFFGGGVIGQMWVN